MSMTKTFSAASSTPSLPDSGLATARPRSGRAMAAQHRVVATHLHHRGDRAGRDADNERAAVASIHDLEAHPLSGKPLQTKIESAFERFDVDGNGAIDIDEFRDAMFGLGLRRRSAEFDKLYSEYDTNGDGQIDLVEFGDMVRSLMKDHQKIMMNEDQKASVKGNGTAPSDTSQQGVHAHAPHTRESVARPRAPHGSGPGPMEPIPASPSKLEAQRGSLAAIRVCGCSWSCSTA